MIKLDGVSKFYRAGDVETAALADVNISIGKGEYVAIMGPSGCGKSTLLSILGTLDRPSRGSYSFDGAEIVGWSESRLARLRQERIGFIFQSFNLLEDLSVQENVALALEYGQVPPGERKRRVHEALERLGIGHRAGHRPSQLSGGQQQRVAIARALIARPEILLADEPTGNLDSAHGDEVMRLLGEINAGGTTIVMVTHSGANAENARRVVRMLDGRIVAASGAVPVA